MFIEMTQFAIPAFILLIGEFLAYVVALYVMIIMIISFFYPGN